MPSPFPGMNPYLEAPELWRGFHQFMTAALASRLNVSLTSGYYADIEIRTVLDDLDSSELHVIVPDTALFKAGVSYAPESLAGTLVAPVLRRVVEPDILKLRTVRIIEVGSEELVTVIEVLSPATKQGTHLQEYRLKRARILRSAAHFVEIDLLRSGERPGREVITPPIDSDYLLLVNHAQEDSVRVSEIWPVHVNQSLPLLPIPLREPDPDVILDLNAVLADAYTNGAYERRIDYRKPVPPPALRPAMDAWLADRMVNGEW